MKASEQFHVNPEITTLLWDLDGTILDSFDYSFGLWSEVLPRHDLDKPSLELFSRNYHGTVYDTARGFAPEVSVDQIEAIVADFFELDNQHITEVDEYLFPDALDLLRRAHDSGLRQIIVTNRVHGSDRGNASPRTMVANSSLASVIDEVICGDEVRERKPNKHAVDGIQFEPNATLVIGDQSVDGQFAANIGCQAIIICRTEGHERLHEQELSKDHCVAVGSFDDIFLG